MFSLFMSRHRSRPHSIAHSPDISTYRFFSAKYFPIREITGLSAACAKKCLLILFSTLLLAGCGGGGGSSSAGNAPSPSGLKDRKLTFWHSGPLHLRPGNTQENPASAPGSGHISYESADKNVAVIDSKGTITAIGAGTTSISANIAEDGEYKSASANYSVNVEALPNTLSFVEPGPFRLPVGSTLQNPATGLGSGTIVYSSSDPKVATIDASGLVEVHALGSAAIQATQQEGRQYLSATASYDIDTSIAMTAWAGEFNTQVSLSPAATGMSLYRSSTRNCDIENFQACENGQVDIVGGTEIVDTAANLERPGFYTLQEPNHEIQVSAWPHHFPHQFSHSSVIFKDKLWIIGHSGWGDKEPIWATEDGEVWHPVKSNFPAERYGHSLVVHHGKLFMIGGSDGTKIETEISDNEMNDVWVTEDGVNWELIQGSAQFAARADHSVVSYNDRLWLIGGVNFAQTSDADTYFSDVWSSEDGVNWTQELEEAPFENRFDHATVVHQGRIWLLGGWGRREPTEVWVSENGTAWNLLPEPAPGRAVAEGVASFRDKLLFRGWGPLGGYGFWSTESGESWDFLETNNQVAETWLHSMKVFKEKLLITGGDHHESGPVSSVFSSADATSWKKESRDPPLPRNIVRDSYIDRVAVVTHKESYWAFDDPEWSSEDINNTYIWKSDDGFRWSRYEISGEFSPFYSENILTSFNDKLWALGVPVSDLDQGTAASLWSSEDGIHWSETVASSELPALTNRRTLVHDDRFWLFGTATIQVASVTAKENQVWSSADGIQWQRESGITEYSELEDYEVASFDGKLWVVSGRETGGSYSRSVWYSSSGKEWQQVVPIPYFAGRTGHRVASYGGKLWLIGGRDRDYNLLNDIWVSEDGFEWTEMEIPASMPSRANFGLVADGNGLWIFGSGRGEKQDLWRFTEGDRWRAGYKREFTVE